MEEKPKLTPPDSGLEAKSSASRRGLFFLLSAFVLLLGLCIVVLWYLPQQSKKSSVPAELPPLLQTEQTEKPETTLPNPAQGEAERLLAEALRLISQLEVEDAPIWGKKDYLFALEKVAQGDQLLQGKFFYRAQKAYRDANSLFQTLGRSKTKYFEAAMAEGTAALNQSDEEAAIIAFERALSIDPENSDAQNNLKRAHNLGQTLLFYREGLELERAGDPRALSLYKHSLSIDSKFQPSIEAVKRVQANIDNHLFQDSMGQFLEAIEQNKLPVAQKALAQAAAVRPSDPAVFEGQKRLQAAAKALSLSLLQNAMIHHSTQENWHKVFETCAKALTISPKAQFAIDCEEKSKKRIWLHDKLTAILSKPERLQENAPLKEARQIMQMVQMIRQVGQI